MTHIQKPSRYISTGEAARQLGVSPSAINMWAREGLLTYHLTPGGHRRFKLDDIVSLARQREAKKKGRNGNGY